MREFQKALTIPINYSSTAEPSTAALVEITRIDNLLSDTKIDEIEEDMSSVDDGSLSDSVSASFSKKNIELRTKRTISEVKTKNPKQKKFFIHKAHSLKKQCESRSKSPVKSVVQSIKNSSNKLKFMKMKSIAFKTPLESKVTIKALESDKKIGITDNEDASPGKHKFKSSRDLDYGIISPVR